MRKRKPRAPKNAKAKPAYQVFCTECGLQLEYFCFSSGVDDVGAIRKTLVRCKKSETLAGEFCAKLFIAEPVDVHTLVDEGPDKGPIS